MNIFGSLSIEALLASVFLVACLAACTEQSVQKEVSAEISRTGIYQPTTINLTELAKEIPVILFPVGSARLSNKARKQIHQIAIMINQLDMINQPVSINGHSDTLGDARRNMVLSRKRAESVSRELALNGVRHSRLTIHALGESQPAASDIGDDGQPDLQASDLNRRVEIFLGKLETAGVHN